jgi:vacuolar-type H+-ATPase subunit I/STV1
MTAWGRRFIVAGLVLMTIGFVFGLVFSLSVDHEARLVAHDAYRPVFELITREGGRAEWQPLEEAVSARSVAHRRATDVHGHSINLGMLLILLGWLLPVIGDVRGPRSALLPALAASAFVYPLGLFLQYLTFEVAGEIVSALGAIGVIAALAGLYLEISRSVDSLHRQGIEESR